MKDHQDSLTFLLNKVVKKIHVLVKSKLEQYGINRGQPPVLFILKNHNGIPQKDIAEKLHITKATLTKIIQRMEKNDLIIKKIDPDDKRNTRIYLSDKALEIQKEIEHIYHEIEQKIVAG